MLLAVKNIIFPTVNILYLSCHEVLEYDELRLLSSIDNLNIFSPGAYWDPERGCELRPPLDLHYPPEWKEKWKTITPTTEKPDHKYHLTEESVEPFDTVIVMHNWDWVFDNWEVIKNKRVIWRDIGQTCPPEEEANICRAKDLGVEIVRYWDGYAARDEYQGHNAIIPFGKFKDDFPEWTGGRQAVIGMCQSIEDRKDSCRFQCWDDSTSGMPRTMYGRSNDGLACWGGPVDYEQAIDAMVSNNAYWYGGTRPAPYTLALMEAMFVGIPIFTVRNPGWESAASGLVSDFGLCNNSKELRQRINSALTSDRSLMEMIAKDQRAKAVKKWDSAHVINLWKDFLGL